MKYIDYKCTFWNRIHLSEDVDINKVIELLKDQKSYDGCIGEEEGLVEMEVLYDTGEEISVDENGGCATIEVYSGDKDSVFQERVWSNENVT